MIILKENKMLARPHKGVFWLIDGKIWAVPFDNQKYKSGISKSGILMCTEKSGRR